MSTSRTSIRRTRMRRSRVLVVLAGLLTTVTAWAPSAGASTMPAHAPDRVAHAEATVLRADVTGTEAQRIERVPDQLSPTASPGDPIYSNGGRCTLGFNVTDGTEHYILTAGHCADVGTYWFADPARTVPIGPTVHSQFPGHDFALIHYANPDLEHPGGYTAASAYVGEPVTTQTPGTGVQSGVVTATNVTVSYGGAVVYGLIQTNICLDQGSSGAPLMDGDRALGIASGAAGSCSSGGTSFFQPVTDALATTGVSIY